MGSNIASTFSVDKLKVVIASNRKKLGEYSAAGISKVIKNHLSEKDEIRIIFAAAPSQNELLNELVKDESIDWSKIVAFHMDEYIGLPENSKELFAGYLTEHIFSKVKFKSVNLINSQTADFQKECRRYEILLREKPVDIVCMGIGENGHIAFNDPPTADFSDPFFIKIVELDEKCKLQQVNDAGFQTVNEVPATAYTLTIPALLSADYLFIAVPGIRKAYAVEKTLHGEISTICPASILRTHSNATLYLDKDSASLLNIKDF